MNPRASEYFNPGNCLLILTLTLLFCGLAIWMVIPAPPVGFYWDDTWYLLMAEWLSGRADHQELAWAMLQMRQYPPLFSLVLSLSGATLEEQQISFIIDPPRRMLAVEILGVVPTARRQMCGIQ